MSDYISYLRQKYKLRDLHLALWIALSVASPTAPAWVLSPTTCPLADKAVKWLAFRNAGFTNVATDDCNLVLTTSSGHVNIAPAVPPALKQTKYELLDILQFTLYIYFIYI